jgi:hypothetical protein
MNPYRDKGLLRLAAASLSLASLGMGGQVPGLLGLVPRRYNVQYRKAKPCLLPDCKDTTTHNGGYCCAEHCRLHRARLRADAEEAP